MTKISNLNFSQKTVETVEVNGDAIKEIKYEFLDKTFKVTIVKNDDEVVVEEVVAEEIIVEEVIEEPVNKKLTIADVKNIIYENIPKKNTAETYFRSVKQVHDNFKEDDVRELLKKKMKLLNLLKPNMTS